MVPKTEAFLSSFLSLHLLSFVNLAQLGEGNQKPQDKLRKQKLIPVREV